MAFPVTTILDEFKRANGGLGGNYDETLGSEPQIFSEEVAANGGAYGGITWISTFGANQGAFAIFNVATSFYELWVRASGATLYGLGVFPNHYEIFKVIGGEVTELFKATITMTAKRVWGLTAEGSMISVWEGASLATATVLHSLTDTSIVTGGKIGFGIEGSTARLDNFGGGTIETKTPVAGKAALGGSGGLAAGGRVTLHGKASLGGTGGLSAAGSTGSVEPTPVPGDLFLSAEPVITYKFTNLMKGGLIAELPLNDMGFSVALNGSGPWRASLNLESELVQRANWRRAAGPAGVWRSAMWVDVDGALLYGGPVTGSVPMEAEGKLQLTGIDFFGYLARRRQAIDYTEYANPESGRAWATTGAPAAEIMYTVLKQAMEIAGSIPINIIAAEEVTPSEFWITFSAPSTQNQTLETMLTQLHQLGYLIGADVAQEVKYVAGTPVASIGVFYPRKGRTVAENGLVIESKLDMHYEVDGTSQSNGVIEQAGGTGATSQESFWAPAFEEEEYPLLEQVVSHASVSPTTQSERVLQAYAEGDLATYAYPLTTPVVKLPMFGRPSILDLREIGDNVRLKVPKQKGELPPPNPAFPDGLDFEFRTVRIDGTIPDEGLPTMEVTLNVPPSETPIVPPA